MTKPSCAMPGCDKPSRNPKSSALCPMHYHRQYRHGSADMNANTAGISASYGRRYRGVYRPGHPLASRDGKVWEHRFVLYETIGAGPHPCHWCGTTLDWLPKGDPAAIQVDHVNHRGDDNRPENLVPSCMSCNQQRAADRRSQSLRVAGWWSEHDTIARLRDPKQRRKSDAA